MVKSPPNASAGLNQPIDWRNAALLPLVRASEIAGISAASLYSLKDAGRLEFKKLAGRTLVTTKSLIELIETAEPWTPSARGAKGRAARADRARASWAE